MEPQSAHRTIRSIIDPRFDALLSRSFIVTKSSNQIAPELHVDDSSPKNNYVTPLNSIDGKKPLPISKSKLRLQGLAIGLLITAVSVTIVLAVLLTRPTATTSTSTVSSCDTLRWNPVGMTIFGNGTNGSTGSELNAPRGVFVDVNDILYVADSVNHRILTITPGTNGIYVATVVAGSTGVAGSTSQTLNSPSAVYVDGQKNLYIADTNNARVQFWPYGAANGSTVAGSSTGSGGTTLDKLGAVYTFYVDKSNNVYVSDTFNSRIVKWPPGAAIGVLVAGNGSSPILWPAGISVDSTTGTVYATDYLLQIVVVWQPGSTVGNIVAGSNSSVGSTPSLLSNPYGLTRDRYGNLYVSDNANHRVQMFCAVNSSFSSARTIAGVGLAQFSSMGLLYPSEIAFDSQMNLYVADTGNHRIQKFLRIM